jgi:hypothetical protein
MLKQERFRILRWLLVATSVCFFAVGCNQTPNREVSSVGGERNGDKAPKPGTAGSGSAMPARAEAPKPIVIPKGTVIAVRTTTALSTKSAVGGASFNATLEEPVVAEGKVIAPKGAEVTGRIVESDRGGRVKGVASLSVRLTALEMEDGYKLDIVTGVYTKDAPTSKKSDAVKVGVASGIGAAIGAIAGGGKGAAIGAGAGAGAGTGVVLATHGKPAEIPAESPLKFKLLAPVTIPPRT